MLRWMTPFLVAIFAIGTSAARGPGAAKPPMAPQRQSLPTRRCQPPSPATSKPTAALPQTRRQPSSRQSAPTRPPPPGAGSPRRQPVAARPCHRAHYKCRYLPLRAPAAPLYVRRGRALVVEEEDPDVLFRRWA